MLLSAKTPPTTSRTQGSTPNRNVALKANMPATIRIAPPFLLPTAPPIMPSVPAMNAKATLAARD
ncbi:MAG: hypothetical protein V1915_00650 [Candidatus Bathyarchaeota archaeon]